jgi:hypothetical protein
MPLVSVTRLRLASRWSYPIFLGYALAAARQARRSRGFLDGWLGTDAEVGFWTTTVWESAEAMRAFRNAGIHMRAMPKLLRWCNEAAYAHWEQPEETAPDPDSAYTRLQQNGVLSKVNAPSARQRAGATVGDVKARPGVVLKRR